MLPVPKHFFSRAITVLRHCMRLSRPLRDLMKKKLCALPLPSAEALAECGRCAEPSAA